MAESGSEPQGEIVRVGWLEARGRHNFTVAHMPTSGRTRGGVVLCQPILTEQYAAQATFMRLARALAADGLAAVRFDYSSTGDSDGDPQDLLDVGEWMEDIGAAVERFRTAGTNFVAVVGMRASANIVAAAAALVGADALVLWDPFPSGRELVRSASLLHRSTTAVDPPRPGVPASINIRALPHRPPTEDHPLGYAFSNRFIDSLRALRLDVLPPGLPTLVLTRTGKLPASLARSASSPVEAATAVGQDALLETVLDAAVVPESSIEEIVSWLRARSSDEPEQHCGLDLEPTLELPGPLRAATESPEHIPISGGTSLFTIRTRAPCAGTSSQPRRAPLTCVLLNSGVQHHIGPNRLYVDLARELALAGIDSLRVDLPGLGESEVAGGLTHPVYAPRFLDDVDAVVDAAGDGAVAVVGLCSGGYHALEAAARHHVAGVVSIHLIPDLGPLGRVPMHRSDRVIWVPDRRWLQRMNRSRLGVAITWRLPGWAWSLLDHLGVQTEQGAGIRRVVAGGTDVVMIVESAELRRPRLWPLLHRRQLAPQIIQSSADHALFDVANRTAVQEVVRRILVGWSATSPDLVDRALGHDPSAPSVAC